MVYINKVYTKNGDQGNTTLGDGSSISKTHPRIHAIGSVDELNAHIGVIILHWKDVMLPTNNDFTHRDELIAIQHDLFDLGADLCTPLSEEDKLRITQDHITKLEKAIDKYTERLQPLRSFVLPGGSTVATWSHLARTVCRRAERDIVALANNTTINPQILVYLNRLSDYLFVIGRIFNNNGTMDVLWEPGKNLKKE